MGILERIKEIELELSRTQNNKATNTHIGLLKSQLSKLRTQVISTLSLNLHDKTNEINILIR